MHDYIVWNYFITQLWKRSNRPSSWNHSSQWQLTSDNNQLNLVILGSNGLSEEFAREIRAQTDDDEVEIDCQLYTLGYRIIDGDVGLPHNSFTTSDFMPHGKYPPDCISVCCKNIIYIQWMCLSRSRILLYLFEWRFIRIYSIFFRENLVIKSRARG